MDAKTSDWQPGPTVCRCCFTEGCYKDISTEYFWMGKREVYAEMLSETFSVSISYSKSGGPNSHSRLICEQCISRLRDAADFRRQVVECEKMFIQHLDPCTSSVEIPAVVLEPPEKEVVKLERVKLEKEASDEEFDDRGFPDDDDDDDDDMDDEPLMKLATKIPKKETMDLRELLSNSKLVLKRKAPATKTKPTVPAKKLKSKKEVKPAGSKAAAKPAPKPVEKKKKENNSLITPRENAKTLIRYTTAYPFRLPESDVVCVLCCRTYEDPEEFRKHMENEHQRFKIQAAFSHISEGYLKVDITDLRCRICTARLEKLVDAAEHLQDDHGMEINFDVDLALQPYILKKEFMCCGICDHRSPILKVLSIHVQMHFVKFTCENCGKSYVTQTSLTRHMKDSCPQIQGKKKRCRKCRKTFSNQAEKRKHLETSKSCGLYLCNVCDERFAYWNQKQQHLEDVHGAPRKTYTCVECAQVFNDGTSLSRHFKLTHTSDLLQCGKCGMQFDNEYKLRRHRIVHTEEKAFACSVCSKAFHTKASLTQHMVLHNEKKFQCAICNKKFNHKVCLVLHMRTKHPDEAQCQSEPGANGGLK